MSSREPQQGADDSVLLERARMLDPVALAHIHDAYYAPILRYITFRVRDRDTAEDLTHDVFVRFLDALRDRRAPHTTMRGWLFGVAAHVVQDFYRKSYRMPWVELDESLISPEAGPAEIVETILEHEALQHALLLLTPEQQHVITLRFGQELPIHDVAQMLGKTEGAVKQLQARAVLALAKHLLSGIKV